MMTAITKPNSFAKNMESNTKRLIQRKHLQMDASLSYRRKARVAMTFSKKILQPRGELDEALANSTSKASNRLFGGMLDDSCEDDADDEQVNNRNRWKSPIGTIADHRMTNNNRIRKQWHVFAAILLSLILCIIQVTVVNGHPDPEPTPIRVSHSYTKTVSNTIPTSTTSRSSTMITSFLPSDAIPSSSSSVINYQNFNTFASNRSSNGGSSGIISSFKSKHMSGGGSGSSSSSSNNSNNNANTRNHHQSSSRRTANNANRKDFSTSPVTSIDRPFYTKITSNDAVATPSYYKRTKSAPTKHTKKSKKSSKPSSSGFGKYSKTKGSKEQEPSSGSMSVEEFGNDDEYAFMPHTTEKSYHQPKLSLEPFFNFLTSLATASREVIMSKEQHHNHQPEHISGGSDITGGSNKYSPSYETINHSMREGAKKSKKSKKGSSSKGKKKNKGHGSKGSKKGSKGSSNRHRLKSIEILESEDEEIELDPTSDEGPIPFSLPNPIIMDSAEDVEEENDDPSSGALESPGGLHILDVLRTPMVPDYESAPTPAAKAEPLVGLGYQHEIKSISNNNNNVITKNVPSTNTSSSSSSSSSSAYVTNPPSGRANINSKGQGYTSFDKYEGSGTNNMSSSSSSNMIPREKQRSERDPMDAYHDQHGGIGVDLQAQESISHAQVLPSPFEMKNNAGGVLAPSQYQYQQQHQQQQHSNSNNDLPPAASASQQVVSITQNNSPEFSPGNSVAVSSQANVFGNSHPNEKNDFVSKYPTTFVYQPNNSPSGPPLPGPQSYQSINVNHSPPNNAAMYGSPSPSLPPSSGPPSRMNKLRPNLHSYYDSSYHNYAGVGENQASEMIGHRHPYGPPHFKPPPSRVMHNGPFPLPSPPRFGNGYGNRPGFLMIPHRGTHYVGHTHKYNNVGAVSSKEPITKPYDDPNTDYQHDVIGNGNNGNNDDESVGTQDISGSDVTGGASDSIDQYTLSDIDDNSVTAAENSQTKKVGIMDSFDLFYKEYKILTWVAVLFVTSMAFLTLLVYLYINNPPTEVVQARQLFTWKELFQNPQIKKFLSSITETSASKRKRRKDDPITPMNDDDDEYGYLKPYGYGFGGKSGRQKRKQTRIKQDKNKFIQRTTKIQRQKQRNSGVASSDSSTSITNTQLVSNHNSTMIGSSGSGNNKIASGANNNNNGNRSPSSKGQS